MQRKEKFDYQKFYNELSEKYPEEEVVYRTPSGIVRKKFVKRLLKKYMAPKFIDIGCGGGEYIQDFPKSFGVDLAFASLLRCKKRIPDVNVLQCFAEQTQCIKSNSFKTVLCSEVIEHIEDTDALMHNLSRILQSGGYLILTCPNYKGLRPQKESTDIITHFGVEKTEYLHTAYKPEELQKMAKNVGLTVVESGSFEKEMRLWRRLSVKIANIFPKIFGKKHGNIIGLRFRRIFFYCLKFTGILLIIKLTVSVGARSYLVAQKCG